jgi:hypothetical protein
MCPDELRVQLLLGHGAPGPAGPMRIPRSRVATEDGASFAGCRASIPGEHALPSTQRSVMKSPKKLAAAAVTAAFLVPLAVFGAPALASSQQASSSQYEYGTTKVVVCHHTGSAKHPWVKITISMQGWLHGHSKHHDFLVTGSAVCPPAAATGASTTGSTTAPTTNGHGNGNGQGNSGNNGGHDNNGHHNKP